MTSARLLAHSLAIALGAAVFLSAIHAAEPPTPLSAAQLAATLISRQQDGASYIRLKMDVQPSSGAAKETLQVQIKSVSNPKGTDLLYQVLWPKERKGEAVLLRKSGARAISGSAFTPPNNLHPLDSAQLREPLFGSALSCEDLIDDFFAWDQQTIVGSESIGNVTCQILESKPGKNAGSYALVRSWIDPARLVPLRVEKYSSPGRVARRIDTTRVANDDRGHPIPANLVVHDLRSGVETELDGSRIKHDVTLTDADFTPAALQQVTGPKGSGE
jgi:Outer membrane lipoprotein-sorting protein